MNCPVCGSRLSLGEIQQNEEFSLVHRPCGHCQVTWLLRHEGSSIVSIIQEEPPMKEINPSEFGFDYTCPYCGFESYVSTVYNTRTGWKCLNCGRIVPNENIKPRGNFQLMDYRAPMGSGRTRRSRDRASTYQRTPRVSRPIPAGAVGIKEVAERIGIEPKKLRSWLRKVGWRKAEEAGSSWFFSPNEAEEVAKNFGK